MAKIAFVQNLVIEYLGVMYLSAILKKHGHTVEMFLVAQHEKRSIQEIQNFQPDIVGFSCTTGMHKWALQFACQLKPRINGKIFLGGPHPTYFPEVIYEPAVDMICRGEGEYALLEIANHLDQKKDIHHTLNCWFKIGTQVVKNEQRALIGDLDQLPFPDRDLYVNKYPYMEKSQKVFMGGRGCPFDCTFCFNHTFKQLYHGKGKLVRYRSVENLIAEMQAVRKKYPMKTIYLQDDTVGLHKEWVLKFTEKYAREIALPFICLMRADLIDEESVRNLSYAGCKNIFFGIETGSEELRNSLLKKKMADEQIKKAAMLLKHYNIKFRTYNMLGLPGESLEDAFSTVQINAEIKTDYPWCSLFYPFPGTEIAEYAQKMGMLEERRDMALPSFFKDSIVKSVYRRQLTNLQKLFFYGVKFPRLMPVIKKLIRLKPNIIFEIAFLISFGWCYWRSERVTIKEMIAIGIRNVKTFFFSKR